MSKQTDFVDKQTTMFKVGYAYIGPNRAMRTGAKLIRAATPLEASTIASKMLEKDYDWFKLNRTIVYQGDNDLPFEELAPNLPPKK